MVQPNRHEFVRRLRQLKLAAGLGGSHQILAYPYVNVRFRYSLRLPAALVEVTPAIPVVLIKVKIAMQVDDLVQAPNWEAGVHSQAVERV